MYTRGCAYEFMCVRRCLSFLSNCLSTCRCVYVRVCCSAVQPMSFLTAGVNTDAFVWKLPIAAILSLYSLS